MKTNGGTYKINKQTNRKKHPCCCHQLHCFVPWELLFIIVPACFFHEVVSAFCWLAVSCPLSSKKSCCIAIMNAATLLNAQGSLVHATALRWQRGFAWSILWWCLDGPHGLNCFWSNWLESTWHQPRLRPHQGLGIFRWGSDDQTQDSNISDNAFLWHFCHCSAVLRMWRWN